MRYTTPSISRSRCRTAAAWSSRTPPCRPAARRCTVRSSSRSPTSWTTRTSRTPPLDPAFESRVAPMPRRPRQRRRRRTRVLVVDDEDDIRRLLRRVLTGAAIKSSRRPRGSGPCCRSRPRAGRHLLDAMLPGCTADICRRIRSRRYAHPDHHGQRGLPGLALRRGSEGVVRGRGLPREAFQDRRSARRGRARCQRRKPDGSDAGRSPRTRALRSARASTPSSVATSTRPSTT